MARPQAKIDPSEVKRLIMLGMSVELVADVLEISQRTLFRRLQTEPELADAMREARINIRRNLRAELLKQALKGNTRILLRLAEAEGILKPKSLMLTGKDGGPIEQRHTAKSDQAIIDETGKLLRQIQDAARAGIATQAIEKQI